MLPTLQIPHCGSSRIRSRSRSPDVAACERLLHSYVLLWVMLSGAVILYNKWLLAYGGFPFPIALTMFHMAFCSLLAFLLVRFGAVTPLDNMTWDLYAR